MAGYSTKVLLIRFSALGDVFLAKDAISLLKSKFFAGEVHFLTKEAYKPAVALFDQSALHIHSLPQGASFWTLLKFIYGLRVQEYSLVIDLHSNLRSRLSCLLLGRPVLRISKRRAREYFLYLGRAVARKILKRTPYWRVMEGRYLLAPSQASSVDIEMSTACYNNTSLGLASSIGFLPHRFICISAESAWETKRWPKANFYNLSRRLRDRGYEVVWIGLDNRDSPPEGAVTLDLRGQLNLQDTAEVLRRAAVLVCNDTGVLHLSESVGTPVVAIYGPTSPELGFGPRLKSSQAVEANLWCRPCSKTGFMCHRFSQPQKCLTDISVDNIFEIVNSFLNQHGLLQDDAHRGTN